MDLAPIVMFVYDRPEHTRRSSFALQNNFLSNNSKLYVFCDGARESDSIERKDRIKQTRNIVNQIEGFSDIEIIENDLNKGCKTSVIDGINYVLTKHKNLIVVEDDIITGVNFLRFMNFALTSYENDKKVFAISGFKYDSILPVYRDTYFLPFFSPWGYAFWKDRWLNVNFNEHELLDNVHSTKNMKRNLQMGSIDLYKLLKYQCDGLIDTWDIQVCISAFIQKKIVLFPNKSLCYNDGFDGTGTHCVLEEDQLLENIQFDLNNEISFKKIDSINVKLIDKLNFKIKKVMIWQKIILLSERIKNSTKLKKITRWK